MLRATSAALLVALARAAAAQTPVPLYDNLGTLTHRISTRVPRAQRYFDQGLRLTYAFNHAEAIRAYREAARLDTTCAICWWGVALAYGPNINNPMDSAAGAAASRAVRRALALRAHASPAEQAYVDALARRYGTDPVAESPARDSAYAAAMGAVARRFPDDLDAATLYAEARMDLRPWEFWARDGSALPSVEEIARVLEGVLRRDPSHPGACHYYIHLVEASPRPERALACAHRLASLMPGAGHIVHMPAHVYIRLGMYAEAEQANLHAAHDDEAYIADQHPDGIYPVMYYPHNLHFLWAVAALQGRRAAADDAIRRLRAEAPAAVALRDPSLEVYQLPPFYQMVWFGEWERALREPRPPARLIPTTGLWRYARGRAFAATGRLAEARQELDSLAALRRDASRVLPEGTRLGFAPAATLLGIAEESLGGEIAAREGRWDQAVARLQEAVRLGDELQYNEPADWYYPPRLSLGAVLLEAGRPVEAEAVYREDQARNPNNGWSLFGLAQALEAQGPSAEAVQVRERQRHAWARADVTLTGSRFR
jgi:tetratricopeptide (TPR) repeat protein